MEDVTVGAGTVLDSETAKAAIQVGAAFLLCKRSFQDILPSR
ncbi:hypothetical protein SSTU70S_06152 [Stutzerimonas stutzeri]